MTTDIADKSIRVSNMDTVNFFYRALGDAIKGQGQVKVDTPAGQFEFSTPIAKGLVRKFEGWDRADNVKGKSDGKIGDSIYQTIKADFEKGGGNPSTFGLAIPFEKFVPSDLWYQNHKIVLRFAENDRARHHTYPNGPEVGKMELWEMSAVATLSGLTPDIFEMAEKLCGMEKGCSLYLGGHDHEGEAMRSYNSVGSKRGPFSIAWNMSYTWTPKSVRATIIREYGHRICWLITEKLDKESFTHVVAHWGLKQLEQPELEGKVKAFAKLKSSYTQSVSKGVSHYLEESVDPIVLRYLDKKALAYHKREAEREMREVVKLSNKDFSREACGGTDKHESIAYLAHRIYRAKAYGIDGALVQRYTNKALPLIESYGPGALVEYHTVCGMLDVYMAYVKKSPEFKEVAKEIAAKIQ